MTILVDASAIISYYSKTDSNHAKAQQIVKKYQEEDFIISDYVFAEVVTILSQREGKKKAIQVGETMKQGYTWINIDQDIQYLAWEIFKKQPSKNVSFIDCTSFVLFHKGVFDICFTFDKDFRLNKIPILE